MSWNISVRIIALLLKWYLLQTHGLGCSSLRNMDTIAIRLAIRWARFFVDEMNY